jgi:hypothetical protein
MGNNILRLTLNFIKQQLWLMLLFCALTSVYAQGSGPLRLDANTLESACAGNGHVISVKSSGGKAPYTYQWQDGATGSFRKDLPSGTYVCTVRDANGQEARRSFTFKAQPAALEVSYQQNTSGGQNNIALEVKGGQAPYSYFWIGSGIDTEASRTQNRLEGLSAGVYQVVVQDANECTANITVNVQ